MGILWKKNKFEQENLEYRNKTSINLEIRSFNVDSCNVRNERTHLRTRRNETIIKYISLLKATINCTYYSSETMLGTRRAAYGFAR